MFATSFAKSFPSCHLAPRHVQTATDTDATDDNSNNNTRSPHTAQMTANAERRQFTDRNKGAERQWQNTEVCVAVEYWPFFAVEEFSLKAALKSSRVLPA